MAEMEVNSVYENHAEFNGIMVAYPKIFSPELVLHPDTRMIVRQVMLPHSFFVGAWTPVRGKNHDFFISPLKYVLSSN